MALDEHTYGWTSVYDAADVKIGESSVVVNDESNEIYSKVPWNVGTEITGMSPANDSDCGLHALNISWTDLICMLSEVSAETHCTTCLGELLIKDVV